MTSSSRRASSSATTSPTGINSRKNMPASFRSWEGHKRRNWPSWKGRLSARKGKCSARMRKPSTCPPAATTMRRKPEGSLWSWRVKTENITSCGSSAPTSRQPSREWHQRSSRKSPSNSNSSFKPARCAKSMSIVEGWRRGCRRRSNRHRKKCI